ncbi:hypothetical protein [Mesorhizobium helmanticense]|uniref:Uncharacterized protein n=1 Tax=Mesorhizobium helmanticense TaxID=1776423 RepID=A0A2T4J2P4_9HYPH|nr:hypothetical protein [Mesorhizobium helmanticense]PTE12117.1 hypothetical protein C9427_02130 [Mesorhizobium helmanticense]
MQELIDFLQTNSALVLANPALFATLAILFGGGGFVVGRYFLAERIANLESRIARRDDEIAELKGGRPTEEEADLQTVPLMATTAEWGDEESALASSLFARTEEKIRLCQS